MLCLVPATATGLHPSVIPAILRAGLAPNVYPCAGELDYFHALEASWKAEQVALLVVEHDVEIDERIAGELLWCVEPWCCFPYNGQALLGCTRFRPGVLGPFPLSTPVAWQRLDQAVHHALWQAGHRPHLHREPRPIHHHDYAAAVPR